MKTDAWWFENKQKGDEILQPDWLMPKTHFGIYAELENITYPFTVCVIANFRENKPFYREFVINGSKETKEDYEVYWVNSTFYLNALAENIIGLPYEMTVEIKGENTYRKTVKCEYIKLHGKITDFEGNPFPAPVLLNRTDFANDLAVIGCWSDKEGNYSITAPKGCYNAFYVDDNSYGKTTLENWSWHMIADRDEEHNFKIGNGEVYSLSVWSNNGGSNLLCFWFRPMVFFRKSEYEIELNGNKRTVNDISPELEIEDISVTLNGVDLKIISLQKVYETAENYTMPAYIVQTERPMDETTGKQTAILEYNTDKRKNELGYSAKSQGRIQFFYSNSNALTLR